MGTLELGLKGLITEKVAPFEPDIYTLIPCLNFRHAEEMQS